MNTDKEIKALRLKLNFLRKERNETITNLKNYIIQSGNKNSSSRKVLMQKFSDLNNEIKVLSDKLNTLSKQSVSSDKKSISSKPNNKKEKAFTPKKASNRPTKSSNSFEISKSSSSNNGNSHIANNTYSSVAIVTIDNYFRGIHTWHSMKRFRQEEFYNLYNRYPNKTELKSLKKACPVIMQHCKSKAQFEKYLDSITNKTKTPFQITFDSMAKFDKSQYTLDTSSETIRRQLQNAKVGMNQSIKSHKKIENVTLKKKSILRRFIAIGLSAVMGLGTTHAIQSGEAQKLLDTGKQTVESTMNNAFKDFLAFDVAEKTLPSMTADEYISEFENLNISFNDVDNDTLSEFQYSIGLIEELYKFGLIPDSHHFRIDPLRGDFSYTNVTSRVVLEQNLPCRYDNPYTNITEKQRNLYKTDISKLLVERKEFSEEDAKKVTECITVMIYKNYMDRRAEQRDAVSNAYNNER